MAPTGFFHHIGTFLLFVSAILLLVTTITAPIFDHLSILKVTLSSDKSIAFGTFGYCYNSATENDCSARHIGYNPALIIQGYDGLEFSTARTDTAKALTRVMVLHPVACCLAFLSFLLALGSGFIGALFAAGLSLVTIIVTVVVLATDFTAFGIIKDHFNDNASDDAHAKFGSGIWTLLAALVLLLLGTMVVLLTCCSARMHKNRGAGFAGKENQTAFTAGGAQAPKRKFWQRRSDRV